MAGKRKRVVINIADKLEAVRRVENGALLRCVAAEYNVGVSTVSDWMQNKEKLTEHSTKIPNRKTMKTSDFEKVNEALLLWFTQQRGKGVPLSGPVLQEKAKMLAELLGDDGKNFVASSGWLDRFKNRYGIRQLTLCGEKMSADHGAVDVFKKELEEMIEGYTYDQIFNADETGLNFKMLPKSSLACVKEDSAPGHKMQKQRITILTTANATGSFRLPLMCIGKPEKNIAPNAMPVFYRAHKSAWMSSDLFGDWFYKQFVPKVKMFLTEKQLPHKAILLVDNAPCHPGDLQDGDIKVRFLPPNVTSLIQPMDQGIIETFKRHYRGFLLRHILHESEHGNKDLAECLKTVNMKDVVYWCAQAWDKVKSSTLKKAWNKLFDGLSTSVDKWEDEDFENLSELLNKVPGCETIEEDQILNWLEADDSELELTDQEIVDMVTELAAPDAADDMDAETTHGDFSRVKADDAFNALQGCLAKKNLQPAAVGQPPLSDNADEISSVSELPQAATSVGDGSLSAWNEKVSTEGRAGESERFAGQLDQSFPPPSTDGESVAEQSYTHSFADTDNQGMDQHQGTSEGGYEDEAEGWDAEAEGSRLERPGGVFEDTLDLFGRYLASILRQLPDTPCYSLQQKFIDEAISARLSFGPIVATRRSSIHKAPQSPEDGNKKPEDGNKKPEDGNKKPGDGKKKPEDGSKKPEDGNKKPLPPDSSRKTWLHSMKAQIQNNLTSNTPSSAEAPVPPPSPIPPVLAEKIKEEVVDEEIFDETCDALDDQGGDIDIEEHELPSVKPEVEANFELVMCDGFDQGSTGLYQGESTVSATSTVKASPFRCLVCPKTFVRSTGLRNHYRNKHPDCDSNFKSKPPNKNEQQSKRPCLEEDRQVSTEILEHCLMDPDKNAVPVPPASAPTTPAQKTLLFVVKPTVSPTSLVAPSHMPSVASISSAMPGPSCVPGTKPSLLPISNKPGPSLKSQQCSSTQSGQNQPFFLDPQYHTK